MSPSHRSTVYKLAEHQHQQGVLGNIQMPGLCPQILELRL